MSIKSIRRHRWFVCLVVLTAFAPAAIRAQRGESPETTLQRAIQKELVEGDLKAAVDLYTKVIDTRGARDAVKAQAWLNLGRSYELLRDANARGAYERVIRDYRGQKAFVSEAQARLKALDLASVRTGLFSDLTYIRDTGTTTYLPERPLGGAVSPDGRFVFVADPMGPVFDLVTREAGYLSARRIADAGVLPNAVFSADGRQIAFAEGASRRSTASEPAELRIATLPASIRESALAGRAVFRKEDVIRISPFGWTGDGRRVLATLSHQDGNSEIASIDLLDGSSRTVKSLGRRTPNRLSLSPDGRLIVYDASAGEAGASRDVFLLSLESGAETTVSDDPGRDEGPLWTPDGRAVAFFSERGGKPGVWIRPVDAGTLSGPARLIRQYDTRVWPIGFARNGTFYYSPERDKGSLSIDPQFLPNYQGMQIFSVNVDENGQRVRGPAIALTNSLVAVASAPRWLPDGTALAFTLRGPGDEGPNMVVRTMSSGTERAYSGLAAYGGTWFRSGKAKLVSRNATSIGGKFTPAATLRLDLENGIESDFMPVIGPMALTADDKTLYIATSGNVRVIDVDSRQVTRRFPIPTQIRGRNMSVESVSLSPDGRTLAMWTDRGLFRVGVDGGGWRELYAADPFDWGTRPVWTRDGRGILIAASDEKRHWRLMRVPADGGTPAFTGLENTLPKDRMMDFDLSPDGTRLVFVGVAPTISNP